MSTITIIHDLRCLQIAEFEKYGIKTGAINEDTSNDPRLWKVKFRLSALTDTKGLAISYQVHSMRRLSAFDCVTQAARSIQWTSFTSSLTHPPGPVILD